MVTKKTRLLSAIAAVLMLVSMLTGVVLPVSAEEINSLTDYHNSVIDAGVADLSKSANYTVSSLAELELLSIYRTTLTGTIFIEENITIPTTGYAPGAATTAAGIKAADGSALTGDANNLAMLKAGLDGDRNQDGIYSEIKGIRVATGWLGGNSSNDPVKAKFVKNLIFRDCDATSIGNTQAMLTTRYCAIPLFENLEFYDCDVIKGAGSNGAALICGVPSVATTFRNIRIENCTMDETENKNSAGSCNVGFLAANCGSAAITAENITLINNNINWDYRDNAQGFVFGEVSQAVTMKNILVVGNNFSYVDPDKIPNGYIPTSATAQDSNGEYCLSHAAIIGCTKSAAAVATINNAIVFGNSGVDRVVAGYVSGSYASTHNLSNVYTDLEKLSPAGIAGTQDATNMTAGSSALEAALTLNAAGVEQKWGLTSEGELTFVKDGEKELREVSIEIRNPEDESVLGSYTDYITIEGKLLDTTPYADQAVLWTEAVDGVIAEDMVIGYVVPDHTCEPMNYQSNNDGTHRYECGCKWTVPNVGVVSCDKTGTSACDQSKKLNVTDVNTEEPALVHMVVSACSLCDYSDPDAVSAKCTGTVTEVGRDPIENSCDLQVFSTCNKCDYEHVKTVVGEHSTEYKYQQSTAYPQFHEVLCSRCNMLLKTEGHTLTWEVTTSPTVDNGGEKTGTCVCGKTETMALDAKEGIEAVIEDDVYINQEFDVKVNLKNSSGIMGMQLKINFNKDEVMLVGIENGGEWPDLVFGGDLPAGDAEDGEVILNLLNPNNMYLDGTMIVLKFKALNNPENLDKTSVITVTEEKTWNYDMEAIEVDDSKGATEVELSIKKGDMNCDGFVNMVDASFLMRYVNEKAMDADKHTLDGTTTLITDKMADLTDQGDGEEADDIPNINVDDVIHLLRYLNGQIAL